jgi:prolyl 4-hydroxylase
MSDLSDAVPKKLKEWIVSSLRCGALRIDMINRLVASGQDADYAAKCIDLVMHSGAYPTRQANDAPYQYEESRILRKLQIRLSDRTLRMLFRSVTPDVVFAENFLSSDECDELIELAGPLSPSILIDGVSGDRVHAAGRTSTGTYFEHAANPLIDTIERRIAEFTNWPRENSEPIQTLHYGTGDEYVDHYDFFPKNTTVDRINNAKGGARVSTVIMYLNDVEDGGETCFPIPGFSIIPKKGAVLYFSYTNSIGQSDKSTLHAGRPVCQGEKWIAVTWQRQHSLDTVVI